MGEKPRVLHIITKMAACGGASKTARLFASRQNRPSSTFEAAIAYGQACADEDELGPPTDVPCFKLNDLVRPISPVRDLAAYRQIRQLLREYGPRVVHTHSSKAGVLGRLAAAAEGVPATVHHVHGWSFHEGMSPWRREVYRRLERRMGRHCDGLLFVAENDRALAQQYRIGRGECRHMIRSGIDVSEFPAVSREGRRAAREELGIPQDAYVVGTVGQMRPQKAPLDFVAVARLLKQANDRARFVWIGDGPMRSDVEDAALRAGLNSALVLAGSRPDVPQLYAALDAFLLTSRWEGLPRTVVEALLVGIPVIATAVPGTAEIISHRETGMLAPPGDTEALAQCVTDVSQDPDLARRLQGSASWAREEFSVAKAVRDLEALYERILARKARA